LNIDSRVGVINSALGHVGQDPIVNFNDQAKRAIWARQFFDRARQDALGGHYWKCAMKQAQLAAAPVPPLFGPANAYPVPADGINFYRASEYSWEKWDVINGAILTDMGPPLDCYYVYDLQDLTRFDTLLTRAMEFMLGSYLAKPLTNSMTLRDELTKLANDKFAEARHRDSQQGSPRQWDVDVLLRARV
jgi:hypothetical protein